MNNLFSIRLFIYFIYLEDDMSFWGYVYKKVYYQIPAENCFADILNVNFNN